MNYERPIVWLDFETTGTDIAQDKIIEIYFLKRLMDGTVETYEQYINPEMEIHPEATKKHGIHSVDLLDKPTFKEVSKEIYDFIKDCDLGGYNIINFDIPILVEEFIRSEILLDVTHINVIDVFKIWSECQPRTLESAYKVFTGKTMSNAHQASYDVKATVSIFYKMIEKFQLSNEISDIGIISNNKTRDYVDFSGKMRLNETGEAVFYFGKYKGALVEDVIKTDQNYIAWLARNSSFTKEFRSKLLLIKKRVMNM